MRGTGQLFRVFCRLFQVERNVSALAYNLSLTCLIFITLQSTLFSFTPDLIESTDCKRQQRMKWEFSRVDISPSCMALLITHMNYSASILNSVCYTL